MITMEQVERVIGHTVYDNAHKKIGTAQQVFLDSYTGQPEWVTVRTGILGNKESFVPLAPAEMQGDEVIVPFSKDQINKAPTVSPDFSGHLTAEDEVRVYDYYGVAYSPQAEPLSSSAGEAAAGTSAPTDDAMTRSEQELRVGKETREAGRARLRKYVVTEEQQVTVPVTHEEVRLEREPITDENKDQAMAGPEISEAEHEVILHEERPVVGTETVPKERVRLAKEDVTEEETVRGQVRKERIEAEGTTDESA
jgi:uncharacterized protein (TIGR02271 family)